jgi:hypothetical protein
VSPDNANKHDAFYSDSFLTLWLVVVGWLVLCHNTFLQTFFFTGQDRDVSGPLGLNS